MQTVEDFVNGIFTALFCAYLIGLAFCLRTTPELPVKDPALSRASGEMIPDVSNREQSPAWLKREIAVLKPRGPRSEHSKALQEQWNEERQAARRRALELELRKKIKNRHFRAEQQKWAAPLANAQPARFPLTRASHIQGMVTITTTTAPKAPPPANATSDDVHISPISVQQPERPNPAVIAERAARKIEEHKRQATLTCIAAQVRQAANDPSKHLTASPEELAIVEQVQAATVPFSKQEFPDYGFIAFDSYGHLLCHLPSPEGIFVMDLCTKTTHAWNGDEAGWIRADEALRPPVPTVTVHYPPNSIEAQPVVSPSTRSFQSVDESAHSPNETQKQPAPTGSETALPITSDSPLSTSGGPDGSVPSTSASMRAAGIPVLPAGQLPLTFDFSAGVSNNPFYLPDDAGSTAGIAPRKLAGGHAAEERTFQKGKQATAVQVAKNVEDVPECARGCVEGWLRNLKTMTSQYMRPLYHQESAELDLIDMNDEAFAHLCRRMKHKARVINEWAAKHTGPKDESLLASAQLIKVWGLNHTNVSQIYQAFANNNKVNDQPHTKDLRNCLAEMVELFPA